MAKIERVENWSVAQVIAIAERPDAEEYLDSAISLWMAEDGIPLIDAHPPVFNMVKPKEDLTKYELNGLIFNKAEDAVAVRDLAISLGARLSSYREECFDKLSPLEPDSYSWKIENKKYFSKELWDSLGDYNNRYNEEKTLFDKELEAWNKSNKVREQYQREAASAISTIRGKLKDLNKLKSKFDKYLEVANNNRDDATRFFLMALQKDIDDLALETFKDEDTYYFIKKLNTYMAGGED